MLAIHVHNRVGIVAIYDRSGLPAAVGLLHDNIVAHAKSGETGSLHGHLITALSFLSHFDGEERSTLHHSAKFEVAIEEGTTPVAPRSRNLRSTISESLDQHLLEAHSNTVMI